MPDRSLTALPTPAAQPATPNPQVIHNPATPPGGLELIHPEFRAGGLQLAGGKGKMKGQLFRIGHLGDVTVDDIVTAIEIIERGAIAVGLPVEVGSGPAAARRAGEVA